MPLPLPIAAGLLLAEAAINAVASLCCMRDAKLGALTAEKKAIFW